MPIRFLQTQGEQHDEITQKRYEIFQCYKHVTHENYLTCNCHLLLKLLLRSTVQFIVILNIYLEIARRILLSLLLLLLSNITSFLNALGAGEKRKV